MSICTTGACSGVGLGSTGLQAVDVPLTTMLVRAAEVGGTPAREDSGHRRCGYGALCTSVQRQAEALYDAGM
ncbi:MAG TPA: hypothetical protein VFB34_02945 [Chloroflexota bacterium]|nr:hypothetical protein [Chloroflexota bacterium]